MTLHQILRRCLARFHRDSRGTSAVEFALIAPALLVVVVAIDDVYKVAYGSSNMQSAVRAGVHYAMAGGTDATVAQTLGNSAWTKKPTGGTLTASKACKCNDGSTLDCSLFCADNFRPQMYITVTATGTFGGDLYSRTMTSTETVRTR